MQSRPVLYQWSSDHTVQLLTLNYEIFTIANIKKKEKNVRKRLLKG